MGFLADLQSEMDSRPPANPANPANPSHVLAKDSQHSQDSRRGEVEERARLLVLAADEGRPVGLVDELDDADVAACAGLSDDTLRAYLRALASHERMDNGLPPLEWGEPVARTCAACGPVLLWATCPDVVKACPWCFRRKAGRWIPRPGGRPCAT